MARRGRRGKDRSCDKSLAALYYTGVAARRRKAREGKEERRKHILEGDCLLLSFSGAFQESLVKEGSSCRLHHIPFASCYKLCQIIRSKATKMVDRAFSLLVFVPLKASMLLRTRSYVAFQDDRSETSLTFPSILFSLTYLWLCLPLLP